VPAVLVLVAAAGVVAVVVDALAVSALMVNG